MIVRLSKIALVAGVALMMTLVAAGNITAWEINRPFVQHVMSMDTTFRNPALMWRAVTDPLAQTIGYLLIIAVEAASALLLWAGAVRLWLRRRASAAGFEAAKALAVGGLALAMLLWGVGFLTIAGEWFAMWQSQDWNGKQAAFQFLGFTGLVLLFLNQREGEVYAL